MEIELLSHTSLTQWCNRLELPPDSISVLQDMAAIVRGDPSLKRIFSEYHAQTALQGQWKREWGDLPFDPVVQAALGERTSQFYLLAYLSALPYTWKRYQDLGVGEQIFHDTMLDFRFYIEDYYDVHGVWGYSQFAWIWRHLACELFRLGRLQYMLTSFEGGVTAFRQYDTGEICLLAASGQLLRADGCAYGTGNPNEDETQIADDAWYPLYESTPEGWRGHRVNPLGFVERPARFLPSSEWELILQQWDTVLDLHIPRKDPLTAETCGASYAQALEFFPRHFPDRLPKALFCHTWMFTPQLQKFLSPESNLVKFQREFYLYPYAGSLGFLWTFVFGEKYPDRATAPRDSSLRRAVLDWLDAGGEVFDLPGLFFHRPDQWGTQPYWK